MRPSTVKKAYKGYFTDGSVFDEFRGRNFVWIESSNKRLDRRIPYFKEGGMGFFGPCSLGLRNGRGSIPGGAVLILILN
jgi:hypothetical protein